MCIVCWATPPHSKNVDMQNYCIHNIKYRKGRDDRKKKKLSNKSSSDGKLIQGNVYVTSRLSLLIKSTDSMIHLYNYCMYCSYAMHVC